MKGNQNYAVSAALASDVIAAALAKKMSVLGSNDLLEKAKQFGTPEVVAKWFRSISDKTVDIQLRTEGFLVPATSSLSKKTDDNISVPVLANLYGTYISPGDIISQLRSVDTGSDEILDFISSLEAISKLEHQFSPDKATMATASDTTPKDLATK